ncbi:hypothetical protein ACO0E1_14935 [Curtobacterium sp. RRHDQ66]|uniref:hypothetical protein n=1 Tax=Curtobacterium guangdongense TaxID=3413380 RepID=UPI003BF1322E
MTERDVLDQLRRIPTEWHRRGMSAPGEIDQIITARLGEHYTTQHTAEPAYADFFVVA